MALFTQGLTEARRLAANRRGRFDGSIRTALRDEEAEVNRLGFRLGTWGSRADGDSPETLRVSHALVTWLDAAQRRGSRYGLMFGLLIGGAFDVVAVLCGLASRAW